MPDRVLNLNNMWKRPIHVRPFVASFSEHDLAHFMRVNLDNPFATVFSKFILVVHMTGQQFLQLTEEDLRRLCEDNEGMLYELLSFQTFVRQPSSPRIVSIFPELASAIGCSSGSLVDKLLTSRSTCNLLHAEDGAESSELDESELETTTSISSLADLTVLESQANRASGDSSGSASAVIQDDVVNLTPHMLPNSGESELQVSSRKGTTEFYSLSLLPFFEHFQESVEWDAIVDGDTNTSTSTPDVEYPNLGHSTPDTGVSPSTSPVNGQQQALITVEASADADGIGFQQLPHNDNNDHVPTLFSQNDFGEEDETQPRSRIVSGGSSPMPVVPNKMTPLSQISTSHEEYEPVQEMVINAGVIEKPLELTFIPPPSHRQPPSFLDQYPSPTIEVNVATSSTTLPTYDSSTILVEQVPSLLDNAAFNLPQDEHEPENPSNSTASCSPFFPFASLPTSELIAELESAASETDHAEHTLGLISEISDISVSRAKDPELSPLTISILEQSTNITDNRISLFYEKTPLMTDSTLLNSTLFASPSQESSSSSSLIHAISAAITQSDAIIGGCLGLFSTPGVELTSLQTPMLTGLHFTEHLSPHPGIVPRHGAQTMADIGFGSVSMQLPFIPECQETTIPAASTFNTLLQHERPRIDVDIPNLQSLLDDDALSPLLSSSTIDNRVSPSLAGAVLPSPSSIYALPPASFDRALWPISSDTVSRRFLTSPYIKDKGKGRLEVEKRSISNAIESKANNRDIKISTDEAALRATNRFPAQTSAQEKNTLSPPHGPFHQATKPQSAVVKFSRYIWDRITPISDWHLKISTSSPAAEETIFDAVDNLFLDSTGATMSPMLEHVQGSREIP